MGNSRRVALFDMDGTLLAWDTQLLFSNFVIRHHRWRTLLLIVFVLALPLALLRVLSEEQMKRLYLAYLWKMDLPELKKLSCQFAKHVTDRLIYSQIRGLLRAHQKAGDLCAMVTASPDFYAKEIADQLGFELCLATEVNLSKFEAVPFFPELIRGNNKGESKVSYLKEREVIPASSITAYSDSKADLPMLQLADEIVLVNPSPSLKERLKGRSVNVFTPLRPWKNRGSKVWQMCLLFLGLKSW